MRARLEGLSEDNAEAWALFQRLASRCLVDLHLVEEVFRHLTADWTHERVLDRVERLEVIYDLLCPPPPKQTN